MNSSSSTMQLTKNGKNFFDSLFTPTSEKEHRSSIFYDDFSSCSLSISALSEASNTVDSADITVEDIPRTLLLPFAYNRSKSSSIPQITLPVTKFRGANEDKFRKQHLGRRVSSSPALSEIQNTRVCTEQNSTPRRGSLASGSLQNLVPPTWRRRSIGSVSSKRKTTSFSSDKGRAEQYGPRRRIPNPFESIGAAVRRGSVVSEKSRTLNDLTQRRRSSLAEPVVKQVTYRRGSVAAKLFQENSTASKLSVDSDYSQSRRGRSCTFESCEDNTKVKQHSLFRSNSFKLSETMTQSEDCRMRQKEPFLLSPHKTGYSKNLGQEMKSNVTHVDIADGIISTLISPNRSRRSNVQSMTSEKSRQCRSENSRTSNIVPIPAYRPTKGSDATSTVTGEGIFSYNVPKLDRSSLPNLCESNILLHQAKDACMNKSGHTNSSWGLPPIDIDAVMDGMRTQNLSIVLPSKKLENPPQQYSEKILFHVSTRQKNKAKYDADKARNSVLDNDYTCNLPKSNSMPSMDELFSSTRGGSSVSDQLGKHCLQQDLVTSSLHTTRRLTNKIKPSTSHEYMKRRQCKSVIDESSSDPKRVPITKHEENMSKRLEDSTHSRTGQVNSDSVPFKSSGEILTVRKNASTRKIPTSISLPSGMDSMLSSEVMEYKSSRLPSVPEQHDQQRNTSKKDALARLDTMFPGGRTTGRSIDKSRRKPYGTLIKNNMVPKVDNQERQPCRVSSLPSLGNNDGGLKSSGSGSGSRIGAAHMRIAKRMSSKKSGMNSNRYEATKQLQHNATF